MHEACADALLELRRRVAALERQVAALEIRPRRLDRQDHEAAAALLPVIARAIGGAMFTVAELCALAATDEALRAAIRLATGPIDRATGKRLGKMLRRLDGADVAGLAVARHGVEACGAVWSVKLVSVAAKPIAAIVATERAA